jgi:hypothetical protein
MVSDPSDMSFSRLFVWSQSSSAIQPKQENSQETKSIFSLLAAMIQHEVPES